MHTWSHGETWFTNKIVSSAGTLLPGRVGSIELSQHLRYRKCQSLGGSLLGVSDPVTVWVVNGRIELSDPPHAADDIVRFDAGGNVLIGELNAGEICVFSRAGRQSNG